MKNHTEAYGPVQEINQEGGTIKRTFGVVINGAKF